MPETRTYYVICEDNCKFESMTKEQIIAAIAEATGATPTHIDDAFITKIKESNANATLTFWKGTQAEFNALGVTAPAYKVGVGSNGKLYFTPFDVNDVPAHASRHASGGSDAITPADIGAAYPAAFYTRTMAAASWSGTTYSFESEYPQASYNISISVAPTATSAQYAAFGKARICGSVSSNIVTALGTVPTEDIPIIIKAVRK